MYLQQLCYIVFNIFFCFYTYKPIKLPAIEKAITRSRSSSLKDTTPLGEKLEIITENDVQETKPMTVPNQVPDDNKAEGSKVSVEMETLTLSPVHQKLPTARWGKPFHSQGILHKDTCKIPENSESANKVEQHNALEGDEAVKVEESTSYEDWIHDQGLSMNSTETTEFHVKVKVEDIIDNENENKNSGD